MGYLSLLYQSIMLPYMDMDKVKSKDLVLAQKLPITDRPYPLANTQIEYDPIILGANPKPVSLVNFLQLSRLRVGQLIDFPNFFLIITHAITCHAYVCKRVEPSFLLFEFTLITKRALNSSLNCLRVARFVRAHMISLPIAI